MIYFIISIIIGCVLYFIGYIKGVTLCILIDFLDKLKDTEYVCVVTKDNYTHEDVLVFSGLVSNLKLHENLDTCKIIKIYVENNILTLLVEY